MESESRGYTDTNGTMTMNNVTLCTCYDLISVQSKPRGDEPSELLDDHR